jgi:hypothetical protein
MINRLAAGLAAKDIAQQLSLSEGPVKNHISKTVLATPLEGCYTFGRAQD